MSVPTINAFINFSTGPSTAQAMIIGQGIFGTNVFADAAALIVDVSDQVRALSTTSGRNATSDQFQCGSVSLQIVDTTGDFNPLNVNGPYYGLLNPMIKLTVSATHNSITYPVGSYFITGFATTTPNSLDDVVYTTISGIDAFRLFNIAQISTVTGATAGDTTSARVSQILDLISWPTSMREISQGDTTVQADNSSARTALAAMQTIETTEYGALFMSKSGSVVFKDRTFTTGSVYGTPIEFTDTGVGYAYRSAQWVLNDQLVYNSASITATGLAAQTASNSASILKYFLHSYNQTGLMMQTTAEALNYARSYVASRAETTVRCDAITLDLYTPNYDAAIAAVLGIDFFDPLTITTTQPGSSQLTKTLQCFGVNHQVSVNSYKITLTTLEPIIDGFIIGSTLYGVIDTSVFSY